MVKACGAFNLVPLHLLWVLIINVTTPCKKPFQSDTVKCPLCLSLPLKKQILRRSLDLPKFFHPPSRPSPISISNHLTAQKTRIQITIFCWKRTTTIKLKWKLFFLFRTKQQQKERRRENNKLLTILQQQFASHWRKKRRAGELRPTEKIVIPYHRLFLCKLNLN